MVVYEFVFEDDDGVGVVDGSFEEVFGVFGGLGGDDFEIGDGFVLSREVLGVLGVDVGGKIVGFVEGDVVGLDVV